MKILYVASEALPFSSSGGLGDVMGSLPASVKRHLGKDADIRVVIPMAAGIRERFFGDLTKVLETTVRLAWRTQYCGIWSAKRNGVLFYFIDNEYYFKRNLLYGNYDDGERFAFFGKAVLELMQALGFFPDILHANDWQSAPAVIYLKRKLGLDERMSRIRVLYTIHNIEYQGIYGFSLLGDIFELAEWDRSVVEYNDCINLMKGAIVLADRVNTVSPRYASEIMTEYYSFGLHYILRLCAGKISGILNGIDTEYYHPGKDPDIPAGFSGEDLAGKAVNKKELQKVCGLPEREEVPVIVMVSRLASHKGFELVTHILEEFICRNDVQFVLLGTGDRELEAFFSFMASRFPQKLAVKLEYSKPLSKLFYAGGDIFLMPSKSEPCGLAQMIASRYGTVPLVRECGGLFDTVKPYNRVSGEGNGFTFTNYNAHEMMYALEEAIALFCDKDAWQTLCRKVMSVDFSWKRSAEKYISLYQSMLEEQ